jgi:hypothetical protein
VKLHTQIDHKHICKFCMKLFVFNTFTFTNIAKSPKLEAISDQLNVKDPVLMEIMHRTDN